jgi:hypothetical protein
MKQRTAEMASAYTTTTAYVVIPESALIVTGDENIGRYLVSNEGSTNALDAKVMGRYRRGTGESGWVDVTAAISVAADGTGLLRFEVGDFEEYATFIKSASGTTALVYGQLLKQERITLNERLYATRTIAAEAADTITVSYQLTKRDAASLIHVTTYTGIQAAAGDLVEAADAAMTISDGTNGSTLAGDDTHEALFATTATGALDVIFTDVAGASSLEFLAILREGHAAGPIVDLHVISYDGV